MCNTTNLAASRTVWFGMFLRDVSAISVSYLNKDDFFPLMDIVPQNAVYHDLAVTHVRHV